MNHKVYQEKLYTFHMGLLDWNRRQRNGTETDEAAAKFHRWLSNADNKFWQWLRNGRAFSGHVLAQQLRSDIIVSFFALLDSVIEVPASEFGNLKNSSDMLGWYFARITRIDRSIEFFDSGYIKELFADEQGPGAVVRVMSDWKLDELKQEIRKNWKQIQDLPWYPGDKDGKMIVSQAIEGFIQEHANELSETCITVLAAADIYRRLDEVHEWALENGYPCDLPKVAPEAESSGAQSVQSESTQPESARSESVGGKTNESSSNEADSDTAEIDESESDEDADKDDLTQKVGK